MAKQDIEAGSAFVRLGVKASQFNRGIQKASAQLSRMGSAFIAQGTKIAAVGAGISATFVKLANDFAATGSDLAKLSSQTGDSVEELSRMQAVAKRLRIDPDDLTGAIEELNIRLGETIRDGVGPAAEAFKQLGLDANRLAKLPLSERLGEIGDALAGIQNRATRGFLADEIFGGDAFKILPLINQGSKGMKELADQATATGNVFNKDMVQAAQEAQQAFGRLGSVLSGIKTQLGAAVAPTVTELADEFISAGEQVVSFIQDNQGLIVSAAKASTAMAALGASVVAAGIAFKVAGFSVGAFGGALTALASPLGVIVLAAAGAGSAFVKFSETGQKAAESVKGTFRDAFDGIGEALKSGELKLAGKVAMAGLKLEWTKGLVALQEATVGFAASTNNLFRNLSADIAEALAPAFIKISKAIGKFAEFASEDEGIAPEVKFLEKAGTIGSALGGLAQGGGFRRAVNEQNAEQNARVAAAMERLQEKVNEANNEFNSLRNEAKELAKEKQQEREQAKKAKEAFAAFADLHEGLGGAAGQLGGTLSGIFAEIREGIARSASEGTKAAGATDAGISNATFSARAAAQLGGFQSRKLEKNTEETADGVGRLVDLWENAKGFLPVS